MIKQRLKKREDINPKDKWKLEDLFDTDEKWQKEFEETKNLAQNLRSFKGKLASSGKMLLHCLKNRDEVSMKLESIYVYAHMRLHENMKNPVYQKAADQVTTLNVEIASITSFIIPEILTISRDQLNHFFTEVPQLRLYEKYLDDILRKQEHVLTEEMEELLAQVGEIGQSPQNIFNMYNDADLQFPSIVNDQGKKIEVTKGNFIRLLKDPSRKIRRSAYESVYNTYLQHKNTLASIYSSSVKKDVFFANVRKYNGSLEAALDQNNIHIKVYDQLIHTVHNHLPLLHRYIGLRKRLLDVDKLYPYDLYTPLVKDLEMDIPFDTAKEIVLKALEPLGSEYLSILKKGFTNGWIDVYENEGKRSGAYSWGAYGTHPFVLLNYQNTINNVFTLAHEMGHAIHSYYSDETQPYIYAGYKIFLAEIASTVNESLLMEYLLTHTQDPKQKLYLLNYYMEQFRGTLYRQTMFAEFEKLTHEVVESKDVLTINKLCTMYHDLNVRYYGPGLIVDEKLDMEWARIPHFYRAYYVYQYATGYSAAIALSQKILKEGKPAVDRYIRFLQSGDREYPLSILKNAGVNMDTPEPIEQALSVFGSILDAMEKQM